jgi:hypothetical protein
VDSFLAPVFVRFERERAGYTRSSNFAQDGKRKMIHDNKPRTMMRRRVRHFLLAITLVGAGSLQGCATSIETLGLGVGIGLAGAAGLLTCAISCR